MMTTIRESWWPTFPEKARNWAIQIARQGQASAKGKNMEQDAKAQQKTAIVVGAGGGVGGALARQLIERGYHVVATVSRPERIADLRQELPDCADIIALNLADADSALHTLSEVASSLSRLDSVVVCAADGPAFRPAEFMPLDAFRRAMEINCVSNLAIFQATLPVVRRDGGRIVFVGSLSGKVGTPLMAGYVASKFGLEGLVDVMRMEASKWGVEVVLLQPGGIDTKMVATSTSTATAALNAASAKERDLYSELYQQTIGRVGENKALPTPDSVAGVCIVAMESEKPEPRYRVGRDAEYLINATRTKSDREIDELILGAYRRRGKA